jgi:hypothetical protein
MRPIMVEDARDLPEGWMNLLRSIMVQGREYEVIEGSHAGAHRKTIDGFGYIAHPDHRPLAPMPRSGLSSPTSVDGIQEYFDDYLVREDGPPGSKAHYVYGKWLAPMIEWAAKYLASYGPGQAHCCLRVGDPYDAKQYDVDYRTQCPWCREANPNPECMMCKGTGFMKDETKRITTPCLVNMSLQIIPHDDGNFYLKHHIVYRSWDALNGWPENMGGFQLFKETIYDLMHQYEPFCWLPQGASFLNGPATWRCWDVHVYSPEYDAAKAWIGL